MRQYMGRLIHHEASAINGLRWHVLGIGRADTLAGIKSLVRQYLAAPSGYAFLHFGKDDEPRQTVRVAMRETDRPQWGLTQTGYGPRIPTSMLVQWRGRWRRVYAAVWGNSPSLYIGPSGDWLATVTPDTR